MSMSKKDQLKAIRGAFAELQCLDLQDGFKDVVDVLFDMNKTGEKRHRKYRPAGIASDLTVNDAAKLFTCEHLLDGWNRPDKFKVDDILSIRNEVLYAQAYAKRFHDQLTPWAAKWNEAFVGIDYAGLMQNGSVKKGKVRA